MTDPYKDLDISHALNMLPQPYNPSFDRRLQEYFGNPYTTTAAEEEKRIRESRATLEAQEAAIRKRYREADARRRMG